MSNTIDQQFIEYIVKSLVSKPDEVKIERRIDEKGVLLELTVDPEDLGRVIGKRGATAQSLRTLLRALGTKQDARYNLKIIDPSGGFNNRSSYDDRSSQPRDDGPITSDPTATDEDDAPIIPADDPVTVEEDVPSEETEHSDRISQARKELADLDDLDV
jgi:predicted RNA-binding protein YlqC (UPF0109 family)